MVAVGSRHVRLLTAGRGRGVLLLHGSPSTADALRPMIDALQRDFLVIAPDTPGNGASDPLPGDAPDAACYADALAELLDALNLAAVAVYGYHTGAVFAAELARRHPSRVSCVVCDGYPLWTPAEARELAHGYLPPLVPTADGAHMASIWSRVIDQNWYFPWHIKASARRIERGTGDIARLHIGAMELLQAGDHYRAPYAAALKADGAARLEALAAPTLVTAAANDVLLGHLDRVGVRSQVTVRPAVDPARVHQEARRWFARYPPPVAEPRFKASSQRFATVGDGQLFLDGDSRATSVYLHDAGESSRQRSTTSGNNADVLGLDLPGHGLSTVPWPKDPREVVVALTDGLAAAGVDVEKCAFDGKGLGKQVAALLTGRIQGFESRAVRVPDIVPRWDGGHLHAAWHFARFRSQYPAWSDRGPGTRLGARLPSADTLHQMALDVLRAGQRTLAQTLPLSIEA